MIHIIVIHPNSNSPYILHPNINKQQIRKAIWHLYLQILLFAYSSFTCTWKYSLFFLLSLFLPNNPDLSRTWAGPVGFRYQFLWGKHSGFGWWCQPRRAEGSWAESQARACVVEGCSSEVDLSKAGKAGQPAGQGRTRNKPWKKN